MANHGPLIPLLAEAGSSMFAVLDGAQFEDLPMDLLEHDFMHRSLYVDHGRLTADQLRTAPQLIWFEPLGVETGAGPKDDEASRGGVLDRLLRLVEDRPAIVFWQCTAGGEALYRHLRGINKILIPKTANMDKGKSYEQNPLIEDLGLEQGESHELVLFRHADSNVMAQVMPSLELHNLSRMLGPAEQLIWAADGDWNEKPFRVRHDNKLPHAPPGPLKLTSEEIERMEDVRRSAAMQRRVSYLRQTCAGETAGLPDEALAEHIRISNKTGHELGLVSEGAQCRWAFIMCKTNGRVLHSPEAIAFITKKGESPDRQVKQFMVDAIDWMKSRSSAGAKP